MKLGPGPTFIKKQNLVGQPCGATNVGKLLRNVLLYPQINRIPATNDTFGMAVLAGNLILEQIILLCLAPQLHEIGPSSIQLLTCLKQKILLYKFLPRII